MAAQQDEAKTIGDLVAKLVAKLVKVGDRGKYVCALEISQSVALEHFDAVGRYREREHDKPVDGGGSYRTRDGEQVPFDGARELAAFVAQSEEAHAAFTEFLQDSVRAD